MENTITFKPSIGIKKLNKAVEQYHFDNPKQLLDFFLTTLVSDNNPKVKKLIAELAESTHKNAPLRFTKPTSQEDKEIRHRLAEIKKGKSVVMHPLK